jgi:glycine cleavage system H protein
LSNIPEDLKFTPTHEWVRIGEDGSATIGISDHAQDALGDIVFIELPEPGIIVTAKQEVAVVESVKAASDIYSPITGEILEINEDLIDAPETVNASPYENAWFFKIRIANIVEIDDLMDFNAYSEHCSGE